MSIKLTGIVRAYATKDGRAFTTFKAGGEYLAKLIKERGLAIGRLPAESVKTGESYVIRPVGAVAPTQEGVYSIEAESAWYDDREGYAEKNILRFKGNVAISFVRPLTEGK